VSTQTLARLAGAGRIALGASIWLLPDQAMGVLGFDADNPQEMALGRVAGTRDIALGAAAMATAGDPRGGAAMARLNAFVDAGDAVAFGSAFLRREGIDRAALGGLVAGASAAAFGLWLAERLAA
jgi:hypothetical protein